jgi:hypothetical protein
MITIRLLLKDYGFLARHIVPLGEEQLALTVEERAEILRRNTRKFTEEEIRTKFK